MTTTNFIAPVRITITVKFESYRVKATFRGIKWDISKKRKTYIFAKRNVNKN